MSTLICVKGAYAELVDDAWGVGILAGACPGCVACFFAVSRILAADALERFGARVLLRPIYAENESIQYAFSTAGCCVVGGLNLRWETCYEGWTLVCRICGSLKEPRVSASG